MVFHMTNELEVIESIKQMKNKKCLVVMELQLRYLNAIFPVVKNSLANVFNKCIVESTFLKGLKIARVVPIQKKATERNLKIIDQLAYLVL